MTELNFLLYVSQATDSLSDEAQAGLREKAMLYSQKENVTGVLVYRKGFFMQYIEGQETELLDLFQKLRGTPRHFNVRVLSRGVLDQRLFNNWSVRWVSQDDSGPSSQSLIDLFETVLSPRGGPGSNEISAILRRFWKNSEVMDMPK